MGKKINILKFRGGEENQVAGNFIHPWQVVGRFLGSVEELAMHPVASPVLITALKFATADVQDLMIEEVQCHDIRLEQLEN